jgi:hypothetical protein
MQPALYRLQITDNDHQEIVEIVSHAAGQVANGFHFLRLTRPLVCSTTFCKVTSDLGKSQMLAIGSFDRIDNYARPEAASVFTTAPAFGFVFSRFKGRAKCCLRQILIKIFGCIER